MKKIISDLDIVITNSNEQPGKPLVWVIDQECLYDLPVQEEYVNMFLNYISIQDVSVEYQNHDGIAVRFTKDGEFVYDFLTSEYFGSILLSSPLVLNLLDYAYGRYVMSPSAMFDGEKFIILNRDTTGLMPWYPGMEK